MLYNNLKNYYYCITINIDYPLKKYASQTKKKQFEKTVTKNLYYIQFTVCFKPAIF